MDKEMILWIQNGNVTKGELNFDTGTVTFYDKFDNVLMRRKGLTKKQMTIVKKQIEKQLGTRKQIGFYVI